jgi:hypothetical protein
LAGIWIIHSDIEAILSGWGVIRHCEGEGVAKGRVGIPDGRVNAPVLWWMVAACPLCAAIWSLGAHQVGEDGIRLSAVCQGFPVDDKSECFSGPEREYFPMCHGQGVETNQICNRAYHPFSWVNDFFW